MGDQSKGKDTPTPTSEPDLEVQDSKDWATGDFALVSSDGWRYRVDSLLLCWASTVLKDTIELCSDNRREVRFTDTQIESSSVLPLFLQLVCSGELPWPNTGTFTTAEARCDLIAFARKYDAERPMKALRLHIVNDLLLQRIPPFFALMMAAAMDDVELSILAFKHRYEVVPVATEDKAFITWNVLSLNPGKTLGDGTWPSEMLPRFPLDYLWACSKAWVTKWGSQYALSNFTAYNPHTRQPMQCTLDIASEYEQAIRTVRPTPAATNDETPRSV